MLVTVQTLPKVACRTGKLEFADACPNGLLIDPEDLAGSIIRAAQAGLLVYHNWAFLEDMIPLYDLSGLDLMGVDLGKWVPPSYSPMSGILLAETNMHGADFVDCDLDDAIFDNATLVDVSFFRANLRGASFKGAHLENVDFQDAKLQGVDFTGATSHQLTWWKYAYYDDRTIFPDYVKPENYDMRYQPEEV